jgi:tight adherence protein B
MASFVTISPLEQSEVRKLVVKRSLAEQEAIHEKSFSFRELRWYARLESSVEIGRLPLSARSIVLWTVAACLGVALLAVLAFDSAWAALLGIAPPFVAWALVNRRVRSVRSAFADQLPETLDVVSSALRAGHGLSSALNVAVEGSAEPLRSELGRAIADEKLGVPLDDALHLVSRRMANRDLMQVALVARLQREAGTNAAEVLDQVATNIRHQMELRRLVRSLTAQGRMSRWIVSLLPFVLFGAMFLLNRDYLSPLWETPGGIAAMIGGCLMILAGSWVIKKIVEFEV